MSGLRVSFSLCASLGPFSTTCSRLQYCTQSYTDHVIVVNPIFDEILLSQQDPGICNSESRDRENQSGIAVARCVAMKCEFVLCCASCRVIGRERDVSCAVIGAELALKPTLNAKLVPAHARLMDTASEGSGVPAASADQAPPGGAAGASSSLQG